MRGQKRYGDSIAPQHRLVYVYIYIQLYIHILLYCFFSMGRNEAASPVNALVCKAEEENSKSLCESV